MMILETMAQIQTMHSPLPMGVKTMQVLMAQVLRSMIMARQLFTMMILLRTHQLNLLKELIPLRM